MADKVICITEAPRKTLPNGLRVYDEAAKPKDDEIQVRVTFPAIREGDLPAIINAIVAAMTLDNKGGQIVGIDEKEMVKMLFRALGNERGDEIAEEMYPSTGKDKYDPDRTKEILPPPIQKVKDQPGVQPTPAAVTPGTPAGADGEQKEALLRMYNAGLALVEASNGTHTS
jgi:hypothetical protein